MGVGGSGKWQRLSSSEGWLVEEPSVGRWEGGGDEGVEERFKG